MFPPPHPTAPRRRVPDPATEVQLVLRYRTSFVPAIPGVRGTTPAGAWSTSGVAVVDPVNRKVDITGLNPGTRYDVRVQAVNRPDLRNPAATANGPWATANNPGSSAYSPVVKSEGVPIVGTNFGEHNLDPRVSINTAVSRTTLNVEWNSISATDVRSNVTANQRLAIPLPLSESLTNLPPPTRSRTVSAAFR